MKNSHSDVNDSKWSTGDSDEKKDPLAKTLYEKVDDLCKASNHSSDSKTFTRSPLSLQNYGLDFNLQLSLTTPGYREYPKRAILKHSEQSVLDANNNVEDHSQRSYGRPNGTNDSFSLNGTGSWSENWRSNERRVHFSDNLTTDYLDGVCGDRRRCDENCKPNDQFLDIWKGMISEFQPKHLANSLTPENLLNTWSGLSPWSNGKSNLWSTDKNNPIWNWAVSAQNKLTELLEKNRCASARASPNYTWTGQLPRRVRTKNPIYSCKVFLGGIPYDLTDSDLHCTFAQYGNIQIQWPGKDIRSAIDSAAANKAGYVYIIFESYDNVAALLNHCTVSYKDLDMGCRFYYNVSSRRQKLKEVQVIPFDIGDRFYMKNSFSGQMEHSRTVFVGALHGMLSADGLAKVMDDLFGGVVFAGLDTDKHKYPLGSGRVSFDNQDSYLKAVSAAFVEIKSARFKKKIQIDPYIENESVCAVCRAPQQSPIFCRDDFKYFCVKCWDEHHSDPESEKHRPIVKNKTNT